MTRTKKSAQIIGTMQAEMKRRVDRRDAYYQFAGWAPELLAVVIIDFVGPRRNEGLRPGVYRSVDPDHTDPVVIDHLRSCFLHLALHEDDLIRDLQAKMADYVAEILPGVKGIALESTVNKILARDFRVSTPWPVDIKRRSKVLVKWLEMPNNVIAEITPLLASVSTLVK